MRTTITSQNKTKPINLMKGESDFQSYHNIIWDFQQKSQNIQGNRKVWSIKKNKTKQKTQKLFLKKKSDGRSMRQRL
jgi:hypothetical protein